METNRLRAYADATLAGCLADLAAAPHGRNNALFRAACRLYGLAGAGLYDPEALDGLLADAGRASGLSAREVRDTLRSAQKAASRSTPALPADTPHRAPRALPPAPPEPAPAPPPAWQDAAAAFVSYAQAQLWSDAGDAAWDYLSSRGLTESTIAGARLGYLPRGLARSRARWGLPPAPEQRDPDRLWLPPGIVFPYFVHGAVWKLSIRALGQKAYLTVSGSANALYGADALQAGEPAVLVEGVFDALAIRQACRRVPAVAAGTTTGARRVPWLALLARCRPVLVAMDADAGGAGAAAFWLAALGDRARLLRPIYDDPAAMLERGYDVAGWIEEGLNA